MADAAPDFALVERLRRDAVRELRHSGAPLTGDRLEEHVVRLIAEEHPGIDEDAEDALVRAVLDEALGLGPLEALMRDPDVTEIMVVRPDLVFVERHGRVEPCGARFADAGHVMHVVDRILSPLGRRVDEAGPMVDARLPDGSRVNVVIPPLAVDGPALTVRRFARERHTGEDLVRLGTLGADVLAFLRGAVRDRLSILVSGGTGSGKTTTLAVLAGAAGPAERIVTIEDAAELRLSSGHVVRLEARPPSSQGAGEVTIRALVRNALRMRPDRIVVGEVRGGEALDMLTAMTTGHAGSLSTIHASSPHEAMRRLALLASMADVDAPYAAITQQVASAIDLVVHQERAADGSRRVSSVHRVADGDPWTLVPLTGDGDGPVGIRGDPDD
mgnify:CR=1 FL=1